MGKLRIILLVAALFTVGCKKGPDQASLQKELQEQLNQRFSEQFEVQSLVRRGSYRYQDSGTSKLLVYFKSQIKLLADLNLESFKGTQQATALSILGATPLGIKGLKPGVNAKGTVVTVYGSRNYLDKGGEWAPAAPFQATLTSQKPSEAKFVSEIDKAEELEARDLSALQKDLRELNQISKFLSKEDGQEFAFELHRLLRDSINRLRIRLAKNKDWAILATGPTSGTYYALGQAFVASIPELKLQNVSTAGSIENVELLSEGRIDFAIVQSDIAHLAFEGHGPFEGSSIENLRAVTALYPEAIHFVAREAAQIENLAGLSGFSVNIGPSGSGTRENALRILSENPADPETYKIKEYSLNQAFKELTSGKLDGLFYTAAYPDYSVARSVVENRSKLLSLDPKIHKKLAEDPSFVSVEIPANTYGDHPKVKTVGVMALLLTHEKVDEEVVKKMGELVFSKSSEIGQSVVAANSISKEEQESGVPIPFHDALGLSDDDDEDEEDEDEDDEEDEEDE